MSIYQTFLPDGFSTVNSYIFSEDPKGLIEFYKKAFYAEELSRTVHPEKGDILNCIIKIGYSAFMISQARGEFLGMRSSFYLFTENVDELHKNALKNGGKLVLDPMDMDYDDRQSGIIDPSGNYWWISKRLVQKNYPE